MVIPFGFSNALITFQHYINNILYNILNNYATAYIDNIFIFSNTQTEYDRHVGKVLKKIINTGLQININKYKFDTKKIKYLKLIIKLKGIFIDKKKVKTIRI